ISDKQGLDTLHPKLVEAADARVNSPEATLGDLAFELGISKSGLKHRFDKIIEIANSKRDNKD
ncbi:MAG: sporulation regulator WhiA, partial [Clostridiales bacterium]|nr:sporulation regulator WhiA [Clostridiales bacterium]